MNISENEKMVIRSQLPDLEEILYEGESRFYKRSFVSIFDHWLSREEFNDIFIANPEEIEERRKKFKDLIHHLYSSTPIYITRFRRDRKNSLSINRVKDIETLDKKCKFQLLNEDYGGVFRFLMPEYSLIYTQGFDWTHLIEYSDEEGLKRFKQVVCQFGLYQLEDKLHVLS